MVSLVVFATGALLTWFRLPAAGRDTFYAEDGKYFVGDWINSDSWTVLFHPYAGYQHLLPRISGRLVTGLLPVSWWANAIIIASCLVVGAVAALVYSLSRNVVYVPIARLGLAAIPILAPMAGVEPIANLANLHSYLLYLMPWLLLAKPRTLSAKLTVSAIALLATASEPQCIIFAPLALWQLAKFKYSRPAVLGWVIGIGIQILTFLGAPRPTPSDFPSFESTIKGYLFNVPMGVGNGHGRVIGWLVVQFSWWIGLVTFAVFLGAALFAYLNGKSEVRAAVLTFLLASMVAWTAAYMINSLDTLNYDSLVIGPSHNLPLIRWGLGASMLLAAVLPLAASVILDKYPRYWPLGLSLVVCLITVMAMSFIIRNVGREGNYWTPNVAEAKVDCVSLGRDHVEIPTSPPGWSISIPCDLLR